MFLSWSSLKIIIHAAHLSYFFHSVSGNDASRLHLILLDLLVTSLQLLRAFIAASSIKDATSSEVPLSSIPSTPIDEENNANPLLNDNDTTETNDNPLHNSRRNWRQMFSSSRRSHGLSAFTGIQSNRRNGYSALSPTDEIAMERIDMHHGPNNSVTSTSSIGSNPSSSSYCYSYLSEGASTSGTIPNTVDTSSSSYTSSVGVQPNYASSSSVSSSSSSSTSANPQGISTRRRNNDFNDGNENESENSFSSFTENDLLSIVPDIEIDVMKIWKNSAQINDMDSVSDGNSRGLSV